MIFDICSEVIGLVFPKGEVSALSVCDTTDKMMELCNELVPRPSNSHDLTLSDYILFPKLKSWLTGERFHSFEENMMVANIYR